MRSYAFCYTNRIQKLQGLKRIENLLLAYTIFWGSLTEQLPSMQSFKDLRTEGFQLQPVAFKVILAVTSIPCSPRRQNLPQESGGRFVLDKHGNGGRHFRSHPCGWTIMAILDCKECGRTVWQDSHFSGTDSTTERETGSFGNSVSSLTHLSVSDSTVYIRN